MISRVVWFVVGLVLMVGAMLATAHFARAANVVCQDGSWASPPPVQLRKPCVERPVPCGTACNPAIKSTTHYCDYDENGNYDPKRPDGTSLSTPWSKQRDLCIRYAAQHHHGGENQNDWMYFCMQQAHWRLCETCQVKPEHNWNKRQVCGDVGSDAYYDEECWAWIPPKER